MTAALSRPRPGWRRLAIGLGCFSLAVGAAELVAPRLLCRVAGLGGSEGLLRAYGVREAAAGVAILASHDPRPWVWGRVAGDALDIATAIFAAPQPTRPRTLFTLAFIAGATALDSLCAVGLGGAAHSQPASDYRDRSGFPHGLAGARGAARKLASGHRGTREPIVAPAAS